MRDAIARPAAIALSAIACLVVSLRSGGALGGTPQAFALVYALFAAPGLLFLQSTHLARRTSIGELPAVAFVASLAVLTPAYALPFLVGASLGAFTAPYFITIAVLTLFAARARDRDELTADDAWHQDAQQDSKPDSTGTFIFVLIGILVLLTTLTAWDTTRTGSVDRWWYLAYMRKFIDAAALDFSEPFFDGSVTLGRFGFNGWITSMAVWARSAGIDPILLYERVAPVVLVPCAYSAALFLGHSLFGRGRTAWLMCLAASLLWVSGSLFPILTRIPEDKILAILIVGPVTIGAALRAITAGDPYARWLWMAAAALIAQSSVHPLVFMIVGLAVIPAAVWLAATGSAVNIRVALLALFFVVGSLLPIIDGNDARSELRADGATFPMLDHPVARVHHARARLIEFDSGYFMVKPALLAHPLTLLALACMPLVALRSRKERAYVIPTTLLPLALAFVPPLATAMGAIVLPWMVYRLLWAIPFAALLAIGLDEACKLAGRYRWIPVALFVMAAMPWTVAALGGAPAMERLELATPASGPFRDVMKVVAELPRGSIIAAAPELSERIPALTGQRVLAASDRASVVFSGDRARGEERLRMRASLMAGLWRPVPGIPAPTHILVEPGTSASGYCGRHLYRVANFELCEFAARPPAEIDRLPRIDAAADQDAESTRRGLRPGRQNAGGDGNDDELTLHAMLADDAALLSAGCTPALDPDALFHHWERPGPWSPRHPHGLCAIRVRDPQRNGKAFVPTRLRIEPILGYAVEEYTVVVTARLGGRPAWRAASQLRLRHLETAELALPATPVDELFLNIVPNFLPFVKLRKLALTAVPAVSPPSD